jgi:hypothetical protein
MNVDRAGCTLMIAGAAGCVAATLELRDIKILKISAPIIPWRGESKYAPETAFM